MGRHSGDGFFYRAICAVRVLRASGQAGASLCLDSILKKGSQEFRAWVLEAYRAQVSRLTMWFARLREQEETTIRSFRGKKQYWCYLLAGAERT